MNWWFHSFLFFTLLFILNGCKVSTSSHASIPEEKMEKVIENSSNWGKEIEGLSFVSEKFDGFESSKVIIKRYNKVNSGLKALWKYNDGDKLAHVFGVIKRRFYTTLETNETLCLDAGFSELNISERAVILKGDLNGKTPLEIWLDQSSSISPKGEYIDDITLGNRVFSLYKDSKKIILDSQKSLKNIKFCWKDLFKILKEREIFTQKVDFIDNISLGFIILREREILVIEKLNNFYSFSSSQN